MHNVAGKKQQGFNRVIARVVAAQILRLPLFTAQPVVPSSIAC
jgi:hypothetical protein